MAMYLIHKQHQGQLVASYRVSIPNRHEKYGYRQQTSLKAFARTQPLLRQNGYTWASITPAESADLPPGLPVVECSDLWDFYRKAQWDYRARVFVGIGDWW